MFYLAKFLLQMPLTKQARHFLRFFMPNVYRNNFFIPHILRHTLRPPNGAALRRCRDQEGWLSTKFGP